MVDHRPGGSYKALGVLQPHRQTRQLGPVGGGSIFGVGNGAVFDVG